MAGTILNLLGVSALDITGITAPSVSQGVLSFTVASASAPGGSTGDIQYNNAGAFGGSNATINAAGTLVLPVGQILGFEGAGYTTSALSWLASDTLAVGNGTEGDVSGGLGLTALILFGASAYSAYDLFHTTIMSGATQNWNLILPETPGASGQVLTTNGIGFTYWSSLASGIPWNNLTSSMGNLVLSNGVFTSEFDQTSSTPWLWKNTTIATALTTNASPVLNLAANYWTGATSAQDTWAIGLTLGAGANNSSTLTFKHTGSTVTSPNVVFPGSLVLGGPGIGQLEWGNANTAIAVLSTNYMRFITNGNSLACVGPNGNLIATNLLGFNGTNSLSVSTAGISWLAAGSLAIGNGTSGDKTGNLSYNRLNIAGVDHAGVATITAAGTSVTVTYAANYTGVTAPVVVVTPTSDPLAAGIPVGYWVVATGVTTAWTGFTINIQTALTGNITFNYVVMGKA